ncbi:MAG: RNA 2',3'-cyclic phosphodiesterase, partial [Sphingomonas sp.]
MLRLFLALRPPLHIREMLFDLMDGIGGARWQDDEQLHVTIRFLGEVDPRLADDIVTEIDRLRLSLTPAAPTVALHAVGQFASRGRTDTLWAGITPHAALTALHRKVDQAAVGWQPGADHRLIDLAVERGERGVRGDARPERVGTPAA